jgi:hypothetical protein
VVAAEFDAAYYLASYSDIEAAGVDPLDHFIRIGWEEGRNPNAVFDTRFYLAHNQDVAASRKNPFVHYILNGREEGRPGSAPRSIDRDERLIEELPDDRAVAAEFDAAYYLASYSDVGAAGVDPLDHFMQVGWKEGRNPNAVFDTKFYLADNRDVAASRQNPFVHYILNGREEGRPGSAPRSTDQDERLIEELPDDGVVAAEFDAAYYLASYSDIEAAGVDPLDHFIRIGWEEGRNPNAVFDTRFYLAHNRDVAASRKNPFVHYILDGREEGRPGSAPRSIDRDERVIEELPDDSGVAAEFDAAYYLASYSDVRAAGVDPLDHFMQIGWKEGRNPNAVFDTRFYVAHNRDIAASRQNPFVHYILGGRGEGRAGSAQEERLLQEESVIRGRFDSQYYLATNEDVRNSGVDPVRHYILRGWREGRNPTPDFSTIVYLVFNEDVLRSGMNPFYHFILHGEDQSRLGSRIQGLQNDYLWSRAPHRIQDITFPSHVEQAEALFVVIVPEHNEMSGGIYSFFSIAKAAYNMRHKHEYQVVLMTRPNQYDVTYLRQSNFRNYEDVFRFDQIARCRKARKIYLQIPEYAAPGFIASLTADQRVYLRSRDRLYVNILNQNWELMPEKKELNDLRAFAHELSQSVAHHSYFSQEHADRYDLPTLLLPAYTDLSGYEAIDRSEKEKLIIYSPDQEPHREPVLKLLKERLPDYRLVEIRGITFDKYMELATRCMFSVTFGEGFDGYLAQPTYQGGIGLAVYREEYFPSEKLRQLPNIFSSEQDMIDNIVARIRSFENDETLYRDTNKSMMDIYNALYSKDDYMKRIEKLLKRDFDIFPRNAICHVDAIRL